MANIKILDRDISMSAGGSAQKEAFRSGCGQGRLPKSWWNAR